MCTHEIRFRRMRVSIAKCWSYLTKGFLSPLSQPHDQSSCLFQLLNVFHTCVATYVFIGTCMYTYIFKNSLVGKAKQNTNCSTLYTSVCPCCILFRTLLLSLGNGSLSICARTIFLFLMSKEFSFVWLKNRGTLQDHSPGHTLHVVFRAGHGRVGGFARRAPRRKSCPARPRLDAHTGLDSGQPRPFPRLPSRPGSSMELPLLEKGFSGHSPLWLSPQCFSILSLFPFRVQGKGRLPRHLC